MVAKRSHSAFLEKLELMLEKFGHMGTGTASDSGVSSNKAPKPALPKRSFSDYDHSVGKVDRDWDGARKIGYLAAYADFFGPSFSYERFEFSDGSYAL